MSKEAAKAFIEKMKIDGAFRGRVMAAKDLETRMELARHEGFDLCLEDIKAIQEELAEKDVKADVEGQHCSCVGCPVHFGCSEEKYYV